MGSGRAGEMKAILTYHSIDGSGSVISVDRATFRRQMEWLSGSGMAVVGLDRVLQWDSGTDAVAITFDDAFSNFVSEAWPVLRDLGLAVTVFVPTDHVGDTNAWENPARTGIPRLPLLDWNAIGRLVASGVDVGSHTRTHADLRKVPLERVADEVVESADRIAAETGRRPSAFSYPYGSLNEDVRDLVAGRYRVAVTTELRPVGPDEDPHRLPRLDSYYFRRPGRMERLGTTAMKRYLTIRRGLRAARSLVMRG